MSLPNKKAAVRVSTKKKKTKNLLLAVKNKSAATTIICVLFSVLLVLSLLLVSGGGSYEETAAEAANNQNLNSSTTITTGGGRNVPSSIRQGLHSAVALERKQLNRALKKLRRFGGSNLPARLQNLRERNVIVGERLSEVEDASETVSEILHGHGRQPSSNQQQQQQQSHHLPPMELDEVVEYLDTFIHSLHETLQHQKHSTHEEIWQAYHDLAVTTLYPWDQEYLKRMPKRRDDGSIFLSVASYRDENCYNTIYQAYNKSQYPEKLFVGLVQQNCHHNCRSGVMSDHSVHDVEPDENCMEQFCKSDIGVSICANRQVRVLDIDEPESLGPYAARYFASKLWYGEHWFMQVDAHMTFAQDWDAISIEMLKAAPSKKPVLSHYPPSNTVDLDSSKTQAEPATRVCGPIFSCGNVEAQMIRLEGVGFDRHKLKVPAFAPFTAAGYFVAYADFLREVPFDPFLPWIFMGEEIIMSTRLWTSGYDIFSPTTAVVGHFYGRKEKPKFWESVNRAFTSGTHNPLKIMVLDRIKHQLGYPEAARDMIPMKSLLTAVEQYSMGTERPLEEYLRIVGLNMTTKEVVDTSWCEDGTPPPGFEKFNHLYPAARAKKIREERKGKKKKMMNRPHMAPGKIVGLP